MKPRYINRSHRIGPFDFTWSTALPGVPIDKERVDINAWGGSDHNEITHIKHYRWAPYIFVNIGRHTFGVDAEFWPSQREFPEEEQ